MSLEGLRTDGFLGWFLEKTQPSLLASLHPGLSLGLPSSLLPGPASTISLKHSPSFPLVHLLPLLCPSFLPQLLHHSLSSQKAQESALGLWSFCSPLTFTVTPALLCLSACLSISLSSKTPPGLPCAVQWGPLLSPHRGGRGEHGARGARQEAGDHGEARRGKAPGVSATLSGVHSCM